MITNDIDTENHIMTIDLIRRYLSDQDDLWTIGEACISARRVSNRTSVPQDAITKRFLVESVEGWAMAVRAVFRSGTLLAPVAVHVQIERYFPGDDSDVEAARQRANEFLRSL